MERKVIGLIAVSTLIELTLPEGATSDAEHECAKEYFPRCMSCLQGIQQVTRSSRRNELPDECQAVKHWKKKHPSTL